MLSLNFRSNAYHQSRRVDLTHMTVIVLLVCCVVTVPAFGSPGTLTIMAHVQNLGWIGPFTNGQVAGTVGRSLRLEALTITASDRHICYQAHVQNIGWQEKVCDGAMAGTTGRSLRMEALRIWVDRGHVIYFAHVQNIGWMGPFQDGETAGTTGRSLRMEAITVDLVNDADFISGTAAMSTQQTAVLRVERDIFRHGGWGFRWRRPDPYQDGHNYSDSAIQLNLGSIVPQGSTITSAVLKWSFADFSAGTDSNRPEWGHEFGGDHARAPRVHGSDSPCVSYCSPAAMDHWGPDAAHWPNRIELNGQSTYWFPPPQSRDFSGWVDLLSIYSPTSLAGNTLTFYGTLQYAVGRPYFATEGWNADTEFDVFGGAQATLTASVWVTYDPPPPTAPPVLTPAGGTYETAQSVVLSDETQDAVMYFTTDGSEPSTNSPTYSEPIWVETSTTIKAMALAPNHAQSSVVTGAYVIERPKSWKLVKNIDTGSINQIAVDAGHVIYVTTRGGLFKSPDGHTWSSAAGDLPEAATTAIAADPLAPGVLYVWGSTALFKTVNGGTNWLKMGLALPAGTTVGNIAIAPTDSSRVYASTWGAYVQCSSDAGRTWVQCGNGLSGGASGPAFTTSIAVSPSDALTVYTSTWRGLLFRSSDGGNTWSSIGGSGPWANGQIYVAPSDPKVLYTVNDEQWFGRGTVLRSIDAGQSWTDLGRPDGIASDASQLAISRSDPFTVYATTSKGLFKTVKTVLGRTAGSSWTSVFTPPQKPFELRSVALDLGTQGIFVGSPYTGVYESHDGGRNWSRENSGIAAANIVGVEPCVSQPETIYAGVQGVGVMKTLDAGVTWSMLPIGQGELLGSLACHPLDSAVLLIASNGNNGSGIWRSTDGGASFEMVAEGYSPGAISFHPDNPEFVQASVSDWQGGILTSRDAGTSWFVPSFWYAYPGAYAYHPSRSNIVFTIANEYTGDALDTVNIAYSTDSGLTWQHATFGQGWFVSVALDQTDPSILYVTGSIATEGTRGVYKFAVSYSSDGVAAITRIPGVFNTGLSEASDINQIVYNTSTGYLYAATSAGVYRSNTQAITWTALNNGLPYLMADHIAVSLDGRLVYAATTGGIYLLDMR